MNDEIDIFFDKSDGSSYIESLIRSRVQLSQITEEIDLIDKLNHLISLELDLSIIGVEKAISEAKKAALKEVSGNNVKPIK
jgi:hypothetical protein